MGEFHDDEFNDSGEVIAKIGPLEISAVDSGIEDLGYFVALDVYLPGGSEVEYTLYPNAETTAELVEGLLEANRLAAEKNGKMEGLGEDAITKCDRVFGLSNEEISCLVDALHEWGQPDGGSWKARLRAMKAQALIAKLEASKGR